MNKQTNYGLSLGILLLLSGFLPARAQVKDTTATLSVQGEVLHPLVLKAPDIAGMKRIQVTVKGDGQDASEQTYSGVALSTILEQAGATMGRQLRGENMSKYVLIKSGDGYAVLFSLAELDSAFSDKIVMLADQLNGKPLPAGKGPFRIVAAGEGKHARWIWEVRSVTVGFAKE
ncbi:MAG: molybdopterin-dependent oxidoreductase [Puia sp.]|nr:molybdopterin-dependent oxidoreductase [Puia sp.]